MRLGITKLILVLFILSAVVFSLATAEDKSWVGSGDGIKWSDRDNWLPTTIPDMGDNITIDNEGDYVLADMTYYIKNMTLGTKGNSTFISDNFILGRIAPALYTQAAVTNRRYGKYIMRGTGKVVLRGQYVDSEKYADFDEPSFIFWVK